MARNLETEKKRVLEDKELMSQLRGSRKAIKKGEVRSFDLVRKELGI